MAQSAFMTLSGGTQAADAQSDTVRQFNLIDAWPVRVSIASGGIPIKWTGPTLKGDANAVPIETLELTTYEEVSRQMPGRTHFGDITLKRGRTDAAGKGEPPTVEFQWGNMTFRAGGTATVTRRSDGYSFLLKDLAQTGGSIGDVSFEVPQGIEGGGVVYRGCTLTGCTVKRWSSGGAARTDAVEEIVMNYTEIRYRPTL